MDNLEVTWTQALSIWWSFCWRAMVLCFLILLPIEGIMMFFFIRNMPPPGQPMDPQESMRVASTMMIAWPFLMAAVVGTQVIAMRWMIRGARWTGFRLAVLPPEQ